MSNNQDIILQNFIIPICRRNIKSRNIDYLFGTAFFIVVPGVFITARHVWEDVLSQPVDFQEAEYGLCVKGQNGENLFAPIKKESMEFAPNDLDIAMGRVDFLSKSPIKLVREPLRFMQDVAAYGYPSVTSELERSPDIACWMDMRGNKGYVNRETYTKAKELTQKQAEAELSFRIETGMSGAPLFISNEFHVGGICTGTRTSEVYEYRINIEEKVCRHLEYGVACMIYSMRSWKPSFLTDSEYAQLF